MGSFLSCLHRERVETSEMISAFLCLNLCILIPWQWQAPGYVFYTLRNQPPELEFESSELHLSHLGVGSIEMQVPSPTPLNHESGSLPAFLSQVPLSHWDWLRLQTPTYFTSTPSRVQSISRCCWLHTPHPCQTHPLSSPKAAPWAFSLQLAEFSLTAYQPLQSKREPGRVFRIRMRTSPFALTTWLPLLEAFSFSLSPKGSTLVPISGIMSLLFPLAVTLLPQVLIISQVAA